MCSGSGNPTSYFSPGDLSTWTMSWKNGRELATASNGTHTVSYDYDVNGLRTYKIVDGVRHDYLYASGQLLRESWTENSVTYTLDFVYDHAGRPYLLNVSTSSGGTSQSNVYYYILNLQGDVVELVNTDGEPVAEYCYDPYGGIFNSSGSLANINPLRYRGYYFDAETGFYYLQSRYYDPTLGRFLNADGYASTGQGFLGYNMFAYCGNNPASSSDPSGEYGGHQPIMVNDGGGGPGSYEIDSPGLSCTGVEGKAKEALIKKVEDYLGYQENIRFISVSAKYICEEFYEPPEIIQKASTFSTLGGPAVGILLKKGCIPTKVAGPIGWGITAVGVLAEAACESYPKTGVYQYYEINITWFCYYPDENITIEHSVSFMSAWDIYRHNWHTGSSPRGN